MSHQRSSSRYDALRQITSAVVHGVDGDAALTLLCEIAAELVSADGCALVRFEHGEGRTVSRWAREGIFPDGVPGRIPLDGDHVAARVFRTGVAAVVPSYDGMTDPRGRLLATEYQSGFGVPVVAGLHLWGVLLVGYRVAQEPEPQAIEWLSDIADLVAMSLPNLDPNARRGVEALLDLLLTSAPVGLAYVARDLTLIRANPVFASIGNAVPDEISNQPVDALVGRYPPLRISDIHRVLRNGTRVLDVPLVGHVEGRGRRHWLVSYYPVRPPRRPIHGVGVVVVDVTREHRAREALRRERDYSTALIDALQDGLAVSTIDGSITDVNDRLCAMTGFTRDQLVGASPPYPYDPPGSRRIGAGLGATTDQPMDFQRADGSVFPVVLSRVALRRVDGSVRGYVATVRDITAQRRAEEERTAMLEAERAARRRAGVINDVVARLSRAVTPAQVVDVLLTRSIALLGASHGVLLEVDGDSLVPIPGERADIVPFLAAGWPTGRDRETLERVARTGATWHSELFSSVARNLPGLAEILPDCPTALAVGVPFGGDSLGVLVLLYPEVRSFSLEDNVLLETFVEVSGQALQRARLYDVARANAEELTKRDALRTSLLRGVSHEFRSPLTAIANAAAGLERVTDADERRDLASVIRDETRRLDRFVANVLDLSRLEGAILEPRLDSCSADELAAGALEAAAALVGPVPIRLEIAPDVPLVRADPVLTERVLLNLIHNAVRHGGPEICLSVDRDGDQVVFAVRDNGRGVLPEAVESIFAPFVGEHDRGGLGLGLALSRGLAESQGGRLELDTEVTDGARFVVWLPVDAVASA